MRFEAGKKYITPFMGNPCYCVGSDQDGNIVFHNTKYTIPYFTPNLDDEWKEYVEPRKGTRVLLIYVDIPNVVSFATFESINKAQLWAKRNKFKYLCIKEIPWIEGEGLELLEN